VQQLILKREKVLGGVKLPAGHLLASIEPTEGLSAADVLLVFRTGSFALVSPSDTTVALHLTRDKVLSGVKYGADHRVATLHAPEDGVSFEDVRLVLITDGYDVVESVSSEPVAPPPGAQLAPPPAGDIELSDDTPVAGDEAQPALALTEDAAAEAPSDAAPARRSRRGQE